MTATVQAKLRLNELFIRFLTEADTEKLLQDMVGESLAASSAHVELAPSPPPSPPRSSSLTKAKEERTPSPVSRFALGVDEVDMAHHRAGSPGAASPVSPTAVRHVVDPSLPHPAHQTATSSPTEVPSAGTSPRQTSLQGFERASGTSSPMSLSLNGSMTSYSASAVLSKPLATTDEIPTFYRRQGVAEENPQEIEGLIAAFAMRQPRGKQQHQNQMEIDPSKVLRRSHFAKLCAEVFDVPTVFRDVVFRRILAASGVPDTGTAASVNYEQVRRYYDIFMAKKNKARRVFELIRRDNRREYLTLDDLTVCARTLVDYHPGLSFLTQSEFQDLYCQTVAIRIIHRWERNRSNVVLWSDFERSDVTEVLSAVDKISDINQILCYFTYEHFYVLYCRFWELDTDRNYLIGLDDLQRYASSITDCVLKRVLKGCGRQLTSGRENQMNFEDFVHFCLCEEDKNHPQAVEYWFRVLDLDEDGILSGFEIQELFDEQKEKFRQIVGDELQFSDMLCQMFDMIGAEKLNSGRMGFTLADLKGCESVGTFFNMLFNANKFLQFEHRDPFAEYHMKQQPEKTDWDRFARVEYDRMANEANAN